MRPHNTNTRENLTPKETLQILKDGNARFVSNLKLNRNLPSPEVHEPREGRWPFATILSCIDSRASAELVFDQDPGDIFSVRIAGHVINPDILGSMEFATTEGGSKLIMVLGHTRSRLIKIACTGASSGNLAGLLAKVSPLAEQARQDFPNLPADLLVERVAMQNVRQVMRQIPEQSAILNDLIKQGRIILVGGIYNSETGIVSFLPPQPAEPFAPRG
jgi:carbonic anhydrase